MFKHVPLKANRSLSFIAIAAMFMLFAWGAVAQHESEEPRLFYYAGEAVVIARNRIEIKYRGAGCIGQFEGFLRQNGSKLVAESDHEMSDLFCLISILEDENGALHLEQGPGCSAYHGAKCSLSGTVYPVDELPDYIR